VPSGVVEQLLLGLWLIVTELVHQGSTVCARPKCRDDISVAETSDVIP
jgi:hypothetical protein